MGPALLVRPGGAVLLLVAGAGTAVATVAVHQLWWGLLLAAPATLATLVALGRGWLTRLPFALGWVGAVAWLAPARPEGDYAISSNASGFVVLGLGLLVLGYAVATLPRPRRVRPGTVRGEP